MNENNMDKAKLVDLGKKVFSILNRYYDFKTIPDIQEFLMYPMENSENSGQVLLKETEEEIFIGIQFAKSIYNSITENKTITAHSLSVIAEELSHFKFLSDVVENEKSTNLLTLETLGEIDRFLSIMHWNSQKESNNKLPLECKNIHQICDFVFTGERFGPGNKQLYIEAENLAFKHLKEAFSDKWDSSYFNFGTISKPAKIYLSNLRNKFLA